MNGGRNRTIDALAFIAGCGHSGTTLLATILSMHPDLYVPLYESEAFLFRGMKRRRRLARVRLSAFSAGRRRIVEKTPRHVRHIPEIRQTFPCARFILLVRDGRDVTVSIAERFPGNFQAGLARWIADNEFVLTERGKEDTLIVRYEDLIADPPAMVAKVCDFLAIAYSPALLEYHTQPNLWYGQKTIERKSPLDPEHNAFRNWQVNQPIFDRRGRWRGELPEAVLGEFAPDRKAGKIMEALGYA